MAINDDNELLKAQISQGPETPSDGVNVDNTLKDLITSVDLLTEAILYTLGDNLQNQTQAVNEVVNQFHSSSHMRDPNVNILDRTRDIDQLKEQLGPVFEDLKTSIVGALNIGLGGIVNIAGKSVNISGSHYTSPLGPLGSMYARGMGSNVASAFGVQDPTMNTLIGEGMQLAAGRLSQFAGSLSTASIGLGAFSVAIGGITVVLEGISEAFSAFQTSVDYTKILLRSDPNAMGIFSTGGLGFHQYRAEIASQLMPGRSEKDIDRLIETALSMRPGAEGTYENVTSMAHTIGMLEDYGVSQHITQRVGYTMMKDLQLNYQTTERAIISLSGVANQHGIEIGGYIDKITQLSKTVRGLGITVEDVNKLFNKFMTDTYASGVKAIASAAMEATEMALSLGGRLPLGEAVYIAMTQGADKRITPSPIAGGFEAMPETLGQLAQHPLHALTAGKAVQAGLGGQQIIYDHITDQLNMMMEWSGGQGDFSDEAMRNARRSLTDELLKSRYGFTGRYGIDEGYTMFVDKLSSGEMTEEEWKRGLKEWSGDPLQRLHERAVEHTNIFKGIHEMIGMIRDVLAGIFLPILQGGISYLAAMATLATTGSIWEAEKKLREMQSNFQRFNEDPSGLRSYYVGFDEATEQEYEKQPAALLGRALGVWGTGHLSTQAEEALMYTKFGLTAAGAAAGAIIGAPAGPAGMAAGAVAGGAGGYFGSDVGRNLIRSYIQSQKDAQRQQQFGKAPKTLKSGVSMDVYYDDDPKHELFKGVVSPVPSQYLKGLTGKFGEQRSTHRHAGVDIPVPSGTPIKAPMGGKVEVGYDPSGYGNYVDIIHPDGSRTRFAHMKRVDVKSGQTVYTRQPLGLSGGAKGDPGRGRSTGAHLHWEYRPPRAAKFGFAGASDPIAWLNRKQGNLAQGGNVNVNNTVDVKINGKPVKSQRKVKQATLTNGYINA